MSVLDKEEVPQEVALPGTRPTETKGGTVDKKSLARCSRTRTTRHHRCDREFLELLEEDYGISQFALRSAFLGMPAAPKKQAMALCEWARFHAREGDIEHAGEVLRGWAKKNGAGAFNPRLVEGPENTYEDNDFLRSIGQL